MIDRLHYIDRWQPTIDAFIASAFVHALQFTLAAVIVFVGNWASHRLADLLARALAKLHTDATFTSLVCNFTKWAIRAIAFIVALSQIGVATASMLTVLGTAGLAIGLALQGSLQNIAAGLMLLLWRPFRVGDFIEGAGPTAGTVAEISLFTTRLTRTDGTMAFVPNSVLWGNPVVNLSANPTRRISISVTIGRQDDIDKALGVLARIADADHRILKEPQAMPWIAVAEYAAMGTRLSLGVWTRSGDYFATQADLLRVIKRQLEEADCEIPGMPVDRPTMRKGSAAPAGAYAQRSRVRPRAARKPLARRA